MNAVFVQTETMSGREITDEIADPENSPYLRILLLQSVSAYNKELDYDILTDLLDNSDTDDEIKENILNCLFENEQGEEFFEEIANGKEGTLAFKALTYLNYDNPEKAAEISDEILNSFDGVITEKVRSAMFVKAQSINRGASPEEAESFVSLCSDVISGKYGTDNIIKDTAVYALKDAGREESISYIINSDDIDDGTKMYCVRENYKALKGMLENGLTEEKLQTVLTASQLYPFSDMAEPLKTALSKNSSVLSDDIKDQAEKVLENIEENGYPQFIDD